MILQIKIFEYHIVKVFCVSTEYFVYGKRVSVFTK